MFLPFGDTPNPRQFVPWVNWLLIGANAAIYLVVTLPLSTAGVDPRDPEVQEYLRRLAESLPRGVSLQQVLAHLTAYDLFIFDHGFKPGAPGVGDLFLSMFLHANFLHLAGNMLFLWIYGDNVEHRLGRAGYLVAYLATGAAATLLFSLLAGESMMPMVGASGAISGVLGLYFVLFPRNEVKIFIFLFPILMDVFLLPARLVLGFYLVVDNLLPLLTGAESGVAYGAHIGGFLAGLAIAYTGELAGWRLPWSDSLRRVAAGEGPRPRGAPPAEETPIAVLRSAILEGDRERAFDALAGVEPRELSRLEPRDCVRLSSWMEEAGHPAAAARLLRSCLAAHGRSKDLAEVYLQLGLARLNQGQPTSAYQHLLSVFDYHPDPETAARARAALDRINVYRRRY